MDYKQVSQWIDGSAIILYAAAVLIAIWIIIEIILYWIDRSKKDDREITL